jgi:hypothetical protein
MFAHQLMERGSHIHTPGALPFAISQCEPDPIHLLVELLSWYVADSRALKKSPSESEASAYWKTQSRPPITNMKTILKQAKGPVSVFG